MRENHTVSSPLRRALFGVGAGLLLGTTGCQIQVGGQTLPSPWYLRDDVQYFAPGPEFKLAREAAAQKAFREDEAAQAGPDNGPAAAPPGPGPGGPPPGPPAGAGAGASNKWLPRFW